MVAQKRTPSCPVTAGMGHAQATATARLTMAAWRVVLVGSRPGLPSSHCSTTASGATRRFCLLKRVWGAILQSKEEYALVLRCPEETGGQGEGCAMKRVEQTVFLQRSRPLLASLQEVLELCLVTLSSTHCYQHFVGGVGGGRKRRGDAPRVLATCRLRRGDAQPARGVSPVRSAN